MNRKLEEIAAEALQLTVEARAALAKHLLESLDDISPEENERLWVEEAASQASQLMLIGLFHQTASLASGSGGTLPYAFPNTLAESYQMAGFRTLLGLGSDRPSPPATSGGRAQRSFPEPAPSE